MADVRVSVDDRAFSASLRRYALAMKMSFAEAILRQARLVAVNLAYQTQPFGLNLSAKQKAEKTIGVEIGRVYKDVGTVARDVGSAGQMSADVSRVKSPSQAEAAFVRLVRSGQTAKAQKLLNDLNIHPFFSTEVNKFDQGSRHQTERFGARRKVPKNTFPKLAVTNFNLIRGYINKIKQRVGTAKAGWASCAQQLGGMRGLPAWITRHASQAQLGSVYDATSASGNQQYVIMTNRVPWIDKCLNAGQIQRALDIQRGKMVTAIRIALRKAKSYG